MTVLFNPKASIQYISKSAIFTVILLSTGLSATAKPWQNTHQLPKIADANMSVGINALLTSSAYDTKKIDVEILPSLFYDNNRLYARGNQFGAYLLNDGNNQLSVYAQTNGVAFNPTNTENNSQLAGLEKRKKTIVAGAEYLRITPIGGFRVQAAHDVIGDSHGNIARLNYVAKYQTNNLTVYPSAGLEWRDKKYNDYYHGISVDEANKTGLPIYTPKQSVHPYINVSARYEFNERWAGFANQNIHYLSDEQADSPMVDGRRSDYKTVLGLLYKF